MHCIDPGHFYSLRCLDIESGERFETLRFVKREGEKYPGNVGYYPGTTTQEVLRALIDRTKYVDGQIANDHNTVVLLYLRNAILELELRAAERHGRILAIPDISKIELMPYCQKCGHIGCEGQCRD